MNKKNVIIIISSFAAAFFSLQAVSNTEKVDAPKTQINSTKTQSDSTKTQVETKTHYDNDNTAKNVRDRDPAAVTPFSQGENRVDLSITQDIRKAIVADDSLSINAKNIKIITENGNVVLRGPVTNAHEISVILAKVKDVKGVKHVDNKLEVVHTK